MRAPDNNLDTIEASSLRVVVCARQTLIARGIAKLLEADGVVVLEVASSLQGISPDAANSADVLLVDFSRPTLPFIESFRRFRESFPRMHVVALTDHGSDECSLFRQGQPQIALGQPGTCCLQQAFMLGCRGAVSTYAEPQELLRVIRGVVSNRIMVEEPTLSMLLGQLFGQSTRQPEPPALTSREQDVVRALAQGRSNKEIGAILGIGLQTVKNHVSHILSKLGLEDRVQIVLYAVRNGLISLDEVQ